MDVVLDVFGDSPVDHVRDVIDVQASRRHVGGDEHPRLAVPKPLHHLEPDRLIEIAGQGRRWIAATPELPLDPANVSSGVAEHDERVFRILVDEAAEGAESLVRGEMTDTLTNLGGCLQSRGGFDPYGTLHETLRQAQDRLRQGCREQEGLTLTRDFPENGSHVVDEAHVQHPVGFIQDHHLGPLQPEPLHAKQVQDAARGPHDDLSTSEGQDLFGQRLTPDGQCDAQIPIPGDLVELIGHLFGQLSCRCQDQGLDGHARGVERLDHRETESQGLPGSGLGFTDDVTAFLNDRDRLLLNRRRSRKAELFE